MVTSPLLRVAVLTVTSAFVGATVLAAAFGFTAWSVTPSPSPSTYGNLFKAAAATSAADAWAVGGGATSSSNITYAAHWNGSAWAAVATPSPTAGCQDGNFQWTGDTLNAVAATSRTDAWAVGHSCYSAATLVEHWNGSAWRIVPSPSFSTGGDGVQNSLNGVAALSPTNAWAVGTHTASNGAFLTLIEHWNGSSWSVTPSPSPDATANVLTAVAAAAANDVWAVGWTNGSASRPLVEHWNGSAWSVVPTPSAPARSQLTGVTAAGSSDVWAVGFQTGSTGARLTLAEHWQGSAWTVVPTPNLATSYGSENVLRGVAAVSSGSVWAAGMYENGSTGHQRRPLTLRWSGTAWSLVSSPTAGKTGELNGIAADRSTGRLFGVGLYSNYPVNIYDGTYTAPRTLVLSG